MASISSRHLLRHIRSTPRAISALSYLAPRAGTSLSFSTPPHAARTPSNARSFTSSPTRRAAIQPRGDYKKLTPADVTHFLTCLSSPSSLITTIPSPDGSWSVSTADDLIGYNKDWMDKYTGHSTLLLKPKSTEEVSKIMKYCYEQRIAVVPQGGNTGLVGGSTPVYDEVILSTEGMREIRQFDEVSGTSACIFPARKAALFLDIWVS